MWWTVAIKDRETGAIRLMDDMERGESIDLDRFERHVVPYREEDGYFVFGVHKFDRDCICRPRIERDHYDYEVVIHEDRKPN